MEIYQHPSLGEIFINPSLKAKRVSIGVRPTGEVRLTIPRRMSLREALRFLDEKAAWVEQTKARVAARQPARVLIEPPYSTRSHTLHLDPCATEVIRVRISGGKIVVSYPARMHYTEETVQEAIRKGIEGAWRVEALVELPERVRHLCQATGLKCGRVTVRNSHTRWGSCSVRDDLSLSLHLMKLPDELIDYVLLHELCHTRHKNHGPRFHALLDELCGGRHQEFRKALRNFSPR